MGLQIGCQQDKAVSLPSGSGKTSRLVLLSVLSVQLGFVGAQLGSMALSRHLWAADLANFIRPHLLVAGIVLFLAGLALPGRAARLAGAVALAAACFPYLLLTPPVPARPGPGFTMVSANVMVDNPDPQPFLALEQVAEADILVLQEVRPAWQEALIASGNWRYESNRDLAASSDMKLMSRFPILDERTVFPESADTSGRHAMRFTLSVEGRPVVVYAIHPQTPRSPRGWRQRAAYLRDLQQAVAAEPADMPVIVAGDWNLPPWSPFLRDFLDATGYSSTEARWWPTPTRFSIRLGALTPLGTPIDRIVVSPGIGLDTLSAGPKFGSNHLPVTARLTLAD